MAMIMSQFKLQYKGSSLIINEQLKINDFKNFYWILINIDIIIINTLFN